MKGLVNGKPGQIYKLLQWNEGIEFLQQHGIDPEETEQGELSQGVGYLETKKSYFYIFLGSVCKLETVMNAVKCQLADMNGLSTK